MDNSNQLLEENAQVNANKASWPLIAFIILVVVAIGVAWQFTGSKSEPTIVDKQALAPVIAPEPEEVIIIEPDIEIPEVTVIEDVVEVIETPLPSLNNSDDWLKLKLPEITWRQELLTLIVDEDMIRRFVVFTDNFSQGIVAYEHSPFVLPKLKFAPETDSVSFQNLGQDAESSQESSEGSSLGSSIGKQNVWQWDKTSSKRFSLYIDLLRSMDSESLVQWYSDIKPLIDEAYQELGYEDDFTNTLQDAITRVLDMELPKSSMALIQPSVMYKFANPKLEALPDTDKLLLRLGKDNLLVIKSVLLELHEKLAQQKNGVR
ncbi:MAG: hypothetical protein COB83_08195 [Gammaproteobacteria bacterium]|nr:MAG: hypothetical protein COB83_08195 [Gammaproteobacteria bacterium]